MKVYRAVVGMNFPDADGLAALKKAGGVSKLADEESEALMEIRVEAGGLCEGLPKSAQKWLLKDGYIAAEDASAADAE